MESSIKNQKVLITILGVTVHRLGIDLRKKLEFGKCSIIKNNQQTYIKIHHFVLNLTNAQFLEIKYPKSISYFYLNQSYPQSICVISIPYSDNSDELLNSFHTSLTNLRSRSMKSMMQVMIQQQQNHQHNIILIIQLNKFNLMETPLRKLQNKLVVQLAHLVDLLLNQQRKLDRKIRNKNKWKNVKQKASKLNDSISQVFKPVNTGIKTVSNKLGQSFDNSNNTIIKAIRDFGVKTKKALNEGYKQKSGQPQVHQTLKNESDSVL